VRRVEQLADELAAELESYTDLPYVLLGHSLGSLVMFEVAKRLEARNRPTQLVVTACGAPQRRTGVYRLGDDAMLERIGILYGTKKMAPLADPELRARFLPVIRADLEAFDTYAFSGTASLAIPLSAYGGRRDALVAEERVQGWKTQTRGPFRCTFLDGDHFFIHEPASGFRKHLIPILEEAATERT
jgi:pyochelin biosynthetic protein PchC